MFYRKGGNQNEKEKKSVVFCAADQPYFYDGIWKCDGQRRTKTEQNKSNSFKR